MACQPRPGLQGRCRLRCLSNVVAAEETFRETFHTAPHTYMQHLTQCLLVAETAADFNISSKLGSCHFYM